MFVKRVTQRKLLEDQYASQGNNLVILYGRSGQGKTSLLTEFLEGRQAFYYEGMECVDQHQLLLMNQQMTEIRNKESIDVAIPNSVEYDSSNEIDSMKETNTVIKAASGNTVNLPIYDYTALFSNYIGTRNEKAIIILDEFHFILKNSPYFWEVFRLLSDPTHPVMFLLCSSSIRWVENEMLESLGAFASYITAYLKLKEFTFVDIVNCFPKASVETCIHINAILGGVPDYLREWQENRSVEDNIKSILLNKNSRLFQEPQQFLKQELREPAVYNTILSALAEGNRKLNFLHEKTGFSRAKILVYLKHLIQQDLVEKLIPLNEEGKENVQKGLYRIKDNFLSFWYRFVFPNRSDLMLGKMDEVYEHQIAPYLNDYMGEYFADVCTEFLKLMNQHQRLPINFLWWDRWYGKNGTIDIYARGEQKESLVGKCFWEERRTDLKDYEMLISLSKEAGITPDLCYLFSKGGFTEELRQAAKDNQSILLVGLEDL